MRLKKKISTEKLAQMWVDLNCWKRPANLNEFLPEDIRKAPPGTIMLVMRVIELAIGTKDIKTQWKKHCDKMDKP